MIMIFWTVLGVAACASYPDEPRTPQAGKDTYSVEEDGFLTITLEEGILANDKPREGTTNILETLGEIDTEAGGKMMLLEDGSFTYDPIKNFNGQDHVKYKIKNAKGKSSEGEIAIDVTPVNDPPQPVNDRLDITDHRETAINVLSNDVDLDGDALEVIHAGEQTNGAVEINQDGSVSFVPNPNHSGDVRFGYTVADAGGEEAQAWVFLAVIDGNSAILQPDTITVAENSAITLPFRDLLSNDQVDPQTGVEISEAQYGTVEVNGDRTFSYAPPADFSGTDSFIYTVQLRGGILVSSTVTVNVSSLNSAPTISDIPDQITMAGVTTAPIPFTVTDPDTPLSDLIITVEISEANPPGLVDQSGITLSGSSENRALWITPQGALSGSAVITVVVTDGVGPQALSSRDSFTLQVASDTSSAPQFLSIDSERVLDPGRSLRLDFTVYDADTPVETLTISAISDNDAIVPNDNRHLEIDGLDNASGRRRLTITPVRGQSGSVTIQLSVSDGFYVTSIPLTFQVGNSAPTIAPVASRGIGINEVVDIPLYITDETPNHLRFRTNIRSNRAYNVINPEAISYPFDAATGARTLHIEPPHAEGTATITITVIDSDGLEGQVQFDLTVASSFLTSDTGFVIQNSKVTTIRPETGGYIATNSDAPHLDTDTEPVLQKRPRLIGNSAPMAENDLFGAVVDETLVIGADRGVLANDRDAEDQPLRVFPQNTSRLKLRADGGLTYTPAGGFSGSEVFTYTVSDGSRTSKATLTLITGGNRAPLVTADGYVAKAGLSLEIRADHGLLANDEDPENDPLAIAATGVFETLFGAEVNLRPDGGFVYQPLSGFNGFDSFTYTATDGKHQVVGVAVISVTP